MDPDTRNSENEQLPKPLSRRQIMKLTATLPFAVLASQACSNPTMANIDEALAAARELPDGERDWIADQAATTYSLTPSQKHIYKLAIVSLWEHFAVGARYEGRGQVTIEPGLARIAYPYTSGAKIAQAVLAGDYPSDGNHAVTNICAFTCGSQAAGLAMFGDPPWIIKKNTYELGWDRTQQIMKPRLDRMRQVAAARDGSNASASSLQTGLGC